MQINKKVLVFAFGALTAGVVWAADPVKDQPLKDQPVTTTSDTELKGRFDSKIDRWVLGNVTELDATNKRMKVSAKKLPYATVHAQMVADVQSKTKDIQDPSQRASKEAAIAAEWQDKLSAAANEDPGKPSEIAINLTDGVQILPDSQVSSMAFLQRDREILAWKGTSTTAGEAKVETATGANLALSDLKVGDEAVVGYTSGILNNDAYAIVKRASAGQLQPSTKTNEPTLK